VSLEFSDSLLKYSATRINTNNTPVSSSYSSKRFDNYTYRPIIKDEYRLLRLKLSYSDEARDVSG